MVAGSRRGRRGRRQLPPPFAGTRESSARPPSLLLKRSKLIMVLSYSFLQDGQ